MSLPQEMLDQLLSGYLDDALSADERARVERLIESDAQVAGELETLREMRAALKAVAKADSDSKLPAGFSDRVLDAAIATARSEGLSDSHPLIKAAEQPSPRRVAPSDFNPSWRAAGVLIALAASIVIAVVALRPESATEDLDSPTVAQNSSNRPRLGEGDRASKDVVETRESVAAAETPDTAAETTQPERSATAESVAANVAEGVHESPDRGTGETSAEQMAAVDPDSKANAVGDRDRPKPAANSESAAMSEPGVKIADGGRGPEMSDQEQPAAPAPLGAVLVLDIERTERGRQSGAVESAMRAVGIGAANIKTVTPDMVGLEDEAESGEFEEDAVIVYLQVSAKRLDQFILKLVADQEGVKSVRFMLAEDAPTLGIAQLLQPIDPTQVRHTGRWQLDSESSDLAGVIARQLSQRPDYLSLDSATARSGAASLMAAPQSGGPDFIAPALLLIR